jgi:hypothetical protein
MRYIKLGQPGPKPGLRRFRRNWVPRGPAATSASSIAPRMRAGPHGGPLAHPDVRRAVWQSAYDTLSCRPRVRAWILLLEGRDELRRRRL